MEQWLWCYVEVYGCLWCSYWFVAEIYSFVFRYYFAELFAIEQLAVSLHFAFYGSLFYLCCVFQSFGQCLF